MNKQEILSIVLNNLNSNKNELINQWNKLNPIPTRYFYIDNLLPIDTAYQLYNDFVSSDIKWNKQSSFRESKCNYAKVDILNNLIPLITDLFQDVKIIQAIEEITKIKSLDADPNLYAGGISMMNKNDFLNPHIDNSHDTLRKRYRRLNLLYYVTPDWEISNGGNLLLWDKKVLNNIKILSKFNRLIIMETNNISWHSVDPVTVNESRYCLSNYYFSKNSPNGDDYYHVTSFSGREDQTLIRAFSKVDNYLRQLVSNYSGISRGKNLSRYN